MNLLERFENYRTRQKLSKEIDNFEKGVYGGPLFNVDVPSLLNTALHLLGSV